MNDAFLADSARDDKLILVDGLDRQIGTATKQRVHCEGLLHRAFSVMLVRDGVEGPQLLLARRAASKYHSGGLWANSCCSHPREGEATVEAAYRRVREELGCEACDLDEIAAFVYRAELAGGLCEYEYDHVFLGTCKGDPAPDPTEADAVRWIGVQELADELHAKPEQFTAWAYGVLAFALAALSHKA